MSVNPVPDGYHTVTPYLVGANVARLIEFLEAAFDAEVMVRHPRPDGSIMHAQVRIGDSHVMMGEPEGESRTGPAMLHLYLPDVDRVYQRALAAGGTSLREPTDQFYGDRMAGVQDPTGHEWWIATHVEEVSPEEMARRAAG